jgi:uncharacterized membrane protein
MRVYLRAHRLATPPQRQEQVIDEPGLDLVAEVAGRVRRVHDAHDAVRIAPRRDPVDDALSLTPTARAKLVEGLPQERARHLHDAHAPPFTVL